jgi:hypothetical protein
MKSKPEAYGRSADKIVLQFGKKKNIGPIFSYTVRFYFPVFKIGV